MVRLDARFVSSANTYRALATAQAQPWSHSYGQPYNCWSDYYYYDYNSCPGHKQNEAGPRASFEL